jgi:hypothetical protein
MPWQRKFTIPSANIQVLFCLTTNMHPCGEESLLQRMDSLKKQIKDKKGFKINHSRAVPDNNCLIYQNLN